MASLDEAEGLGGPSVAGAAATTGIQYGLAGAAAGSVVPGVGTAIGGGLGLLVGAIMGGTSTAKQRKEQAAIDQAREAAAQDAAQLRKAAAGQAQLSAMRGGAPMSGSDQVLMAAMGPASSSGYDRWHQEVYGP